MRIDSYRSKASKQGVQKYYAFIGEDAKKLLKDWILMRPKGGPDALFITYDKRKRGWVPVKGRNVADTITKVAMKIGLIKKSEIGRYHIHAHEFSDLFKSLCTLSDVSPIALELFLGHTMDKLGYDKSPQYDEEWFRREYMKVEPRLNLLSNPSGGALEARIEEIRKQVALEAIRRFVEAFGIDPMKVRIEKQRELGRELNADEEI